MRREYAIIVAGGKGTRMGGTMPKQFIEINGRPMVFHTIDQFGRYSDELQVILGLPGDDIPTWENLCDKHDYKPRLTIVKGGKTRFQTVRNCLSTINDTGLVAIHDGVRPLVEVETIAASFDLAAIHGTAVAAVRLKESLRKNTRDGTAAVDRSLYRSIQTPQTFDLDLIRKAYTTEELEWMTDDASVAEHAGHSISLFEGSYENLKITTASDLVLAEAILKNRS